MFLALPPRPAISYTRTDAGLQPLIPAEETKIGKEYYLDFVDQMATKYGISGSLVVDLIDCENDTWNPDRQSEIPYNAGQISRNPHWGEVGEYEKSFGLAQIHIPADHTWKGEPVTEEMAKDPYFSIEFIAHHVSEGRIKMWSCSKLI